MARVGRADRIASSPFHPLGRGLRKGALVTLRSVCIWALSAILMASSPSSRAADSKHDLPIENREWRIDRYFDGHDLVHPDAGAWTALTLKKGSVGGRAPCGGFYGRYTLRGDELTVPKLGWILAGLCLGDGFQWEIENDNVVKAFSGRLRVESHEGEIVLRGANDQVMAILAPVVNDLTGLAGADLSVMDGRMATRLAHLTVRGDQITAEMKCGSAVYNLVQSDPMRLERRTVDASCLAPRSGAAFQKIDSGLQRAERFSVWGLGFFDSSDQKIFDAYPRGGYRLLYEVNSVGMWSVTSFRDGERLVQTTQGPLDHHNRRPPWVQYTRLMNGSVGCGALRGWEVASETFAVVKLSTSEDETCSSGSKAEAKLIAAALSGQRRYTVVGSVVTVSDLQGRVQATLKEGRYWKDGDPGRPPD